MFSRIVSSVDWILFFAVSLIVGAGLLTMNSFVSENYFFEKQLISVIISFAVFFAFSLIDWSFLRRSRMLIVLFFISVAVLLTLFITGSVFKGAQSWFNFGFFAFQPADPVKLVTILLLAKYFSKRHIEIANFKHIFVSGTYAFIFFILVLLQPDFGSAIIIFFVWFGMVMVSGISKKHLLLVFLAGALSFGGLWFFVFQDYQKDRIKTFLDPLADIQGAGYNAYQSTIAVGSGQVLGKGVGFGTQSRLQFLPEYETDFIFASFAEEWGFLGVILLFSLFAIVIWRILLISLYGATNFETLFGLGLAVLFVSHFIIHIGMNIGLLPVTGVTIPFMSYGGSHLLTEFMGLGILMGMREKSKRFHKEDMDNEFLGS
ncbi:rod shape-determining protein RodA [Candidatus Campbellbacteria bacterium RIFCSPLOWO2_01_FULL_34_15]|uniref:Rod shape-determining protein RodA n=2 Tax=Candidatus Campbelliibacteriota TaxID=1752727 RepID=A0A1F5EMJ2_9BACT|nr:MAG: rod shape-determining protein RodA [Candidatus Campbellbacteria bacterium RIFCSPHIGHO2_01_FULL_34_10]OGD68612.1 MAG: rod shape-determining protein RodA [Candidatus Campbellbacteria bacterium RIFCSPLOWO2_01_FULL_34_15]